MGLLGNLFDRKICDICGEEIRLLGNRKLEDGNMCKNCASKLSVHYPDRRGSTVGEIKEHLAIREANAREIAEMHPTRVFGNGTRIYIDDSLGKFCVTSHKDFRAFNPDLIPLANVMTCEWDVKEHKSELYDRDKEGKRVSFDPPRFETKYEFDISMKVDMPWFSDISFELSTDRPKHRFEPQYREYERQAKEICEAMKPAPETEAGDAANTAANLPEGSWMCSCGSLNQGNFCPNCGAAKPVARKAFRCSRCGWTPEDPANPPKFCPNCGDPFGDEDRA